MHFSILEQVGASLSDGVAFVWISIYMGVAEQLIFTFDCTWLTGFINMADTASSFVVQKYWRATRERVEKFISDTYFTDVNLRGR